MNRQAACGRALPMRDVRKALDIGKICDRFVRRWRRQVHTTISAGRVVTATWRRLFDTRETIVDRLQGCFLDPSSFPINSFSIFLRFSQTSLANSQVLVFLLKNNHVFLPFLVPCFMSFHFLSMSFAFGFNFLSFQILSILEAIICFFHLGELRVEGWFIHHKWTLVLPCTHTHTHLVCASVF